MPYEGEFAQLRSIKRLVEDPFVAELLRRAEERKANDGKPPTLPLQAQIQPSGFAPKMVVAIDGGNLEHQIKNGFPGAEISYITVSSVLIDMELLRELDRNRPINPALFRKIENASSVNTVLPGCNVVFDGAQSARSSFRDGLYRTLAHFTASSSDGIESLRQTYEALLQHRQDDDNGKCPYEDCAHAQRPFHRGEGEYHCPCASRRPLYSTDALRIHEGVAPAGSSGRAFGEARQVLEHLWLVHILRIMEKSGLLRLASQLAFVMDGPLAVYGHPAWLSTCIFRELCRINDVLRHKGLPSLLIIGIEKSGAFATHFDMLDISPDGMRDILPRQTAWLLDDKYIKQNIIFSESNQPYGHNTYYGRKIYYKAKAGARLVANIACLNLDQRDIRTARIDQFSRLSDVLALLDQLESARYPNAVIPLIAAHAEAALPFNIGKKVLEELARRLMGGNSGGSDV